MANTKSSETFCSRCNRAGHSAKDGCFFFAKSRAKQAEREAKEREREVQKAARRRSLKEFDEETIATDVSTLASSTFLAVDEAEVERLTLLDKDVRKFAKILREIEKLEGRPDLDELQTAKLRRRGDIEVQLDSAKGLAKVRARDQLRRQAHAE